MQYMVTGVDGKEYGPTDVATLRSWVAENRLAPHTQLRDFNTGQTLTASAVPGLFPPPSANVPPVGAAYPRAGTAYAAPVSSGSAEGGGIFAWIVIRSILGCAFFFLMHGIGLLITGSSLLSAFQLQQRGSKWGVPALAISGLSVAAVGIGWILRLSAGH